jgi:aldehyde dehydrogenase (NAD+)
MNTITKHYIDGAFVDSHGLEVMDIINPTNCTVIAQVTLADEEDARCGIAAAKRAFATFGRTTKEERAEILRRLHEVVKARIDDLTSAMVEEYGGPAGFSRAIIEAAANVFLAAEKALQERTGQVHLETVPVMPVNSACGTRAEGATDPKLG